MRFRQLIPYMLILVILTCQLRAQDNTLTNPDSINFSIQATSLVEKGTPEDQQICLVFMDTREPGTCLVRISMPGRPDIIRTFQGNEIQPLRIKIPVLKIEEKAKVLLEKSGHKILEKNVLLKPPKLWRIYDVQVSHHDLGYADYYHMMRRDVREWGIELALDYCRHTDSWPAESRFHWTVETSEPMTGFLQYQTDSVISELARRIREGRIDLGGLHNSVSTEHMSYEVLARAFYTPNRYIVDWMDIPPSKTALITDVVGFVRSLPLFTREADISFFMMGINSTVLAFDQAYRDPVYYWKAQDNDSNMTLFKTWPYYSPDRLVAYSEDELLALVARFEARTDYPYSAILSEDSYDFGLPEMTNVERIRDWNEKYSNPVLISGTFTRFFQDISSQENLRKFNVYDKDAPNAWADEDLADARLEGEARILGYEIPWVEKLSTLVTASAGARYPWSDLYQAYNRLLMYHEHTNGAYAEGPIYVPPSLKDSSAANANYYEVEQEMHRSLIGESREYLDRAKDYAVEGLSRLVATGDQSTIAVYNPLNFVRTDVVTLILPAGGGGWLVKDNSSGRPAACQKWPDGTLLFVAADVPSCGYKTYSLEPGPDLKPSAAVPDGNMMENRFYKIIFDPSTGGISSIFDKDLKRELVDQEAPSTFNEYLFQRYESTRYSSGLKSYKPERADMTFIQGTLANMMISFVKATGCEKISQKVIIYNDLKRIDFILDIDKSPSGRTLSDYRQGNAKNKEALFYCLPFQVPDFTIRHELPASVVEPIADQFNGSSTDYYGIQHFTDLSNPDFGITLATVEAPLVEYGKPRPATWSRGDDYEHTMKKPENSRVYLYLLNNMFFTNIRMSQPGQMTFHWSVRSHSGDWKNGKAYRFGWETSHPLVAMLLPAGNKGNLPADGYSFFETDRENVVCSTIKPAEANGEGIICRFFELAGEETAVNADFHFIGRIKTANETNLVESDRNIPVRVTGRNRLYITLQPHGIKTLRIIPDEPAMGPVTKVQARALSDRQISLNWNQPAAGNSEVAYYQIYRSKNPSFDTDLRHLIGTASGTDFIDEPVLNYGGWINNYLEPGSVYYYRICPVSSGNIRGPASMVIRSSTLPSALKDLPPGKVEGFHVVHVSPITNDNYLCLFFYSRIESDVERYLIFRSRKQGFIPAEKDLIGQINASQVILHTTPHGFNTAKRKMSDFIQQMYADESVEPNVEYYYRVCAVDRAGNRGEFSDEKSGNAVLGSLIIEGNRFFFSGGSEVVIKPSFNDGSEVRYTLDGSNPTRSSFLYQGPFAITQASILKAAVFYPDSDKPEALTEARFATALYPAPQYKTAYGARWAGSAIYNLVDGQRGEFWTDGYWQGFEYDNLDVILDLGKTVEISKASLGALQFLASWIFLPVYVEFFLSIDGIEFTPAGKVTTSPDLERVEDVIREYTVEFRKQPARYIRVVAKNKAICPDWHLGAGGRAWIFADEITIR